MLAVLMNWWVSPYADDGHPHELLHQAPAEPVHKAGVWYNVSSHLLETAIPLSPAGSAADAGVAAESALPRDEVALKLQLQKPAGSCGEMSAILVTSNGCPPAVQCVAACLLGSCSIPVPDQAADEWTAPPGGAQERFPCTVLLLRRCCIQHKKAKHAVCEVDS